MNVLLPLLFNVATASPHEAEVKRLDTEMTRLAQKDLWSGVDRKYRELLELKRAEIPPRVHLLGAQAAQALYDVGATHQRAEAALAAAGADLEIIEKASRWLSEVEVGYSPITVELSVAYPAQVELVPLDLPAFAPPRIRGAIEHAGTRLAEDRRFEGFLPKGRYRIGDTVFEVFGEDLQAFIRPPKDLPATEEAPSSPEPTVAVPERTVDLAVRGGGWEADDWQELADRARAALYQVDGVLSVDTVQPQDPWIVVVPDLETLDTWSLTTSQLAGALRTGLDVARMVVTEEHIAFPPGTTDVQAVGRTVVTFVPGGETPTPVQVVDVATIRRPLTGPYLVPRDTSPLAEHRLVVRARADVVEKLLPALSDDAFTPLELTLEATAAP